MVSDVRVNMDVDTSQAKRSIQDVEDQADEVVREWRKTERTLQRQINRTTMQIRALIDVFRNVIQTFIGTLDPVADAIIETIFVTMESVLAVHRMIEAGSGGLSIGVTATLSSIAILTAFSAVSAAIQGKQEARENYENVIGTLEALQGTVEVFGA